jgi:hypothetical protein
MSSSQTPVIACDLGALSAEERERRAALAQSLVAQAAAVRELADGYALELRGPAALARESLDWLLLERRCCPFLRLELELEPEDGPLWLRLRGGAGVKEFLAAAGLASRSADATAHCC